jgi:metal-responsive CopG/Arc/MetJ family transcriptional regulator
MLLSMAKVMISMPEELLRSLDAAARRQSASRSEFIRQLVRTELEAEDLAARRERGIDDIRTLTGKYQLGAPPEELIRMERER